MLIYNLASSLEERNGLQVYRNHRHSDRILSAGTVLLRMDLHIYPVEDRIYPLDSLDLRSLPGRSFCRILPFRDSRRGEDLVDGSHRAHRRTAERTDGGRRDAGGDFGRVRRGAADFHASSWPFRFGISLALFASQPDARQP